MKEEKLAVALSYPEWAEAPFVLANTKGFLAESLLHMAEKEGILIQQDKVLAQVLSVQQVGSYVPVETYEVLAKIFAFIQRYGNDEQRN